MDPQNEIICEWEFAIKTPLRYAMGPVKIRRFREKDELFRNEDAHFETEECLGNATNLDSEQARSQEINIQPNHKLNFG